MKLRLISRIAPAVVAALVLASCGGDDSSTVPSGTPADAAPPGSDAGSEPGLRAPTPVEVVGGGDDGVAPSAQASPAVGESGDVATSDMSIAPWIVEYVVGEGMPPLPADDTGYVFESPAGATPEQVAAIASAFGLEGDPVRVDDGIGVSWRVGPDDGSAPSLWVSGDGTLSWNYNAAWDDGLVREVCAVSVDADGNETSDCPEPEPPQGVPTAGEAEERARQLLTAMGVDPDALTFETFADEWFAGVDASDPTDERGTIRSWHFGFVGDGVLQYAGGAVAEPQPVGPYPLVDLDTALARLAEGYFGGFGVGGVGMAEPVLAAETEGATEPAEVPPNDETPEDEPRPDDAVEPVEPVADEPVIVTLVDVVADLWWAWDPDGTVWLLPAYRFIDTDGGWHTVPAVADEFLVVVEPPMIDEPVPVEPDGGIGDGGEPIPDPEPLPTSPPGPKPDVPPPGVPDAVDDEPAPDTVDAVVLLEQFVGLSIEEFTAEADALGFVTRVSRQDGVPLAITADYSETRVNVAVEGPRVVAIESIG